MVKTLTEKVTETPEGLREYLQERLILQVTELICKLMEEKGVKRIELARKLGKTNGYISQLLNGNVNMTLRTISDVLWALDASLECSIGPLKVASQPGDMEDLFRAWENLPEGDMAPTCPANPRWEIIFGERVKAAKAQSADEFELFNMNLGG